MFCNAEFDRSAHTGIGENRKLLGDNKRTTPTHAVKRPIYTTMDGALKHLNRRIMSVIFHLILIICKKFLYFSFS